MVVERAQFLDMNMESAQVMTALGALLLESGALKRADMLLRQALEFFWRELKGPHPAVARCYRVCLIISTHWCYSLYGACQRNGTILQPVLEDSLYGTSICYMTMQGLVPVPALRCHQI